MLVEWEDDIVRLVDLQGFRRASHFPHNLRGSARFTDIPDRRVSEAIVHHSAGGSYTGLEAVERLAGYFLAPPTYKRDEAGQVVLNAKGQPIKTGGGRGWPGIPYTFVVPARPAVEDGRLVVYRIWPDSMRTWHTGGVHNSHGVGICVGGWYTSAADPLSKAARARPDDSAITALDHLVDYLAGRYRLQLRAATLLAHREAGGTVCPGDFLADWVRAKRGEVVAAPAGAEDRRDLSTVRALQTALVEVGFDPGPVDGRWGPLTASGVKALQVEAGLRGDGIFGPLTERALRVSLAAPR